VPYRFCIHTTADGNVCLTDSVFTHLLIGMCILQILSSHSSVLTDLLIGKSIVQILSSRRLHIPSVLVTVGSGTVIRARFPEPRFPFRPTHPSS
jgi:hypothetical protein